MAKKIYKVEIEPLTGVHIGTGEVLTKLNYTVKKTKSGIDTYMKFSPDAILKDFLLKNKNLNEFYAASDRNDMKKIMEFFHNNITGEVIEYPCDVTKDFFTNYKTKKDPIENACEVLQMYRPAGKKTPVIPGGSLKGAIRTAVLDDILTNTYTHNNDFDERCREFEKHDNDYKHYEKQIQQELLEYKDAKNDPFRTFLIADAAFAVKNTQLVGRLKNISQSNISTGMQIQAEIIRGLLIDGQAKTETSITIDVPLQRAKFSDCKKSFSFGTKTEKVISMSEIADICNDFFIHNFEDEYEKFYKNSTDSTAIIEKLKTVLHDAIDRKDTFIVRLGRWSQVEFLTFQESFRCPNVPRRRNKPQEYGTSRTVLDYDGNYVPLGWCKCTYKLCE